MAIAVAVAAAAAAEASPAGNGAARFFTVNRAGREATLAPFLRRLFSLVVKLGTTVVANVNSTIGGGNIQSISFGR